MRSNIFISLSLWKERLPFLQVSQLQLVSISIISLPNTNRNNNYWKVVGVYAMCNVFRILHSGPILYELYQTAGEKRARCWNIFRLKCVFGKLHVWFDKPRKAKQTIIGPAILWIIPNIFFKSAAYHRLLLHYKKLHIISFTCSEICIVSYSMRL